MMTIIMALVTMLPVRYFAEYYAEHGWKGVPINTLPAFVPHMRVHCPQVIELIQAAPRLQGLKCRQALRDDHSALFGYFGGTCTGALGHEGFLYVIMLYIWSDNSSPVSAEILCSLHNTLHTSTPKMPTWTHCSCGVFRVSLRP